ncbi:MAG: hypothetical protein PVG39_24475 [Desulfobacteraceae bacterium]
MAKNQKICFLLSIYFILFLPDIAMSDENNTDQQGVSSNKISMVKMRKKKCLPWIDERYYMMIIGPNCHSDPVDPEIIVKKTYDPNIHHELRIIDPYTKREITGYKGPCFGSFRQKYQPKGKRYETSVSGSVK